MRILLILFLLSILGSCDRAQVGNANDQEASAPKPLLQIPIAAIDAGFPLYLNEIVIEDNEQTIQLNDGINSRIEQTIHEYYFKECSGDSLQTYFSIKGTYIHTIRLHDSLQTVFLVLLQHPTGYVNCKVLFYDNLKKEFALEVFDFNLFALYHFENGKFISSNLKTAFKINTPEIELVDSNEDGINDFKFTRLYHNGTANSIQTTILTMKNAQIDTLDFDEKWQN